MANGIRKGDPRGFNKGRSSKFHVETPEEGQRIYRQKRCWNNNKDEDNSPKTLNDISAVGFREVFSFSETLISFIRSLISFW